MNAKRSLWLSSSHHTPDCHVDGFRPRPDVEGGEDLGPRVASVDRERNARDAQWRMQVVDSGGQELEQLE